MLGWLRRAWTERHGARAVHFHTLFAAATLAVFVPLVAYHGGWGSRVLSSGARPLQLTCRQMFWNFDFSCGQNGISCDPVTSTSSWIPIRCPARCNWPDATLIVRGGGTATFDAPSSANGSASSLPSVAASVYRGDSRICVAAVHAGVVSPVTGGCALVRLRGPASNFAGSVANGVTSLKSPFWFPKSLELTALDPGSVSSCTDITWVILAVGSIWIALLALLVRARRRPFLFWIMAWGFWYTTLVAQQVSDPQQAIVDATSDFCIFAAAVVFAFAVSARTTLWPDGAEAHSDSGSMLQDIDSDDEDGASPDSGCCAGLLCSSNDCDCERAHFDESNSEQLQFEAVATSISVTAASDSSSARRPSSLELRNRDSSVGIGGHGSGGGGESDSHGALSVPLAPSGDARPPLAAANASDRKPYFWSRWNDRIAAFFDTYPGSGQLLAFAPAHLLFCHQNMFIYFLADIDISSSLFSRGGSSALAMATVIAMLVAVLAFAAYFLRVLCRRPRRIQCCFAASYGLLVLVFAILMAIFAPDFSLHLHHAFLPLVLLPLTRARKDPVALIALGILCGMLTNGIACWGWAPNFASNGAAATSSARLPAPRLVGNLTSSSLALAMERLPSASALSAFASFPIVSVVAPAALLIPAAKWNSLLAASRAPSVAISISADGERRAVLLGRSMNHASEPERQSTTTFTAVTQIDSSPSTRGDDDDSRDVGAFVSHSRLMSAHADSTSFAEFSAASISLQSMQTAAISSANVATAQITVLPNMVLLMNGVEMYRSVAESVNVTISKLALNASYYFHFARYSAYSGRLYGAGEALFVSTYQVPCFNQTGGVGGFGNATQSC